MEKVAHCEVIVAESAGEFEKLLNEALKKGYAFCGNPFITINNGDKTYHQIMVTDY